MKQIIRQQVLQRDKSRCTECGYGKELHVHHDSYPLIDIIDNLRLVCRKCHKKIHDDNPLLHGQWAKMIKLDHSIHADLTELGSKNESYSKIVRRLIDAYKVKK
jgi:ribosomal protein S27AE